MEIETHDFESSVQVIVWTTLGFLLLITALHVLAYRLARSRDLKRIQAAIERQGDQLIFAKRRLLGPGWLADNSARYYDIRFRNKNGDVYKAICKTSLLGGAYFTDIQPSR